MVQPVRSVPGTGWACLFRGRHWVEWERSFLIVCTTVLSMKYVDQLDQVQSRDACTTGAFRIEDIVNNQRHVEPDMRIYDATRAV
jgi:hypothetical protein